MPTASRSSEMQPNVESMEQIPGGAAAILESITDAFFALNTDWQFTYVNRQAEKVLGQVRGDMLGKTVWSVYPGVAGSEFGKLYRRVAQEQTAGMLTSFFQTISAGMKSMSIQPQSGFPFISAMSRNVLKQKTS
jgi:PAS domain S-box-containing protein